VPSSICVGGSCEGNKDYTFNGYLKDLRIWKVFRSPGRIARERNYLLRGDEVYLLGYWKFDEQIQDTIIDYSDSLIDLQRPDEDFPIWTESVDIVALHNFNHLVCSSEEIYDSDTQSCRLPLEKYFNPVDSNTMDLDIQFSSVSSVQDFTFQTWIYFLSLTDTLTIEWTGRFKLDFGIESTYLYGKFTLLGDVETELTSFYLEFEKWYQISFSFSLTDAEVSYYIYDYANLQPVVVYREETAHEYGVLLGDTKLQLITALCDYLLREVRLYNQFYFEEFNYGFLER